MPITRTTRRRGRPRSENPRSDKRTACLTESEGRAFNAWMRARGIAVDNEALRIMILERLAADGVNDPGPDSEEGQLAASPWRPNPEQASQQDIGQLALTA